MSGLKKGAGSLALPVRLAGSVAVIALAPLLAAMPAMAQTAQTAQAAPQTETIEVTGTRIHNADAASANPITVVSSDDIAKTSATTLEEVLVKLPSVDFTGGVSSAATNGGNGFSAVGLRNLGAVRTLVLVDGQRMVQTDNQGLETFVDLGSIPAQLIDHIDVLRDGASSVYGADAIGGVINVVLKKHFSGVSLDTNFGITDKSDGMKYGVSSTMGSDFDRGNVVISASYDHQDPIAAADRAFSTNQFFGGGFPSDNAVSTRIPGASAVINGTKFYFGNNGQFINTSTLTPGVALTPAQQAVLAPGVFFDQRPEDGAAGLPLFDITQQQLI